MSKPRSVQLAIRQISQQRQQLLKVLSRWQQEEASALEQLDQLKMYAQDMKNFRAKHPHRTWHPAWLIQHHQFLDRLEDAIQKQTQVLEDVQSKIKHCEARLMAYEQRQKLLERWDEHQQNQGVMQELRRNQQLNDELAQRFVAPVMKVY